MDRETLFLILIGLVCGCFLFLFIIVSYLCGVVRQIREDLADLSKNANIYFERAMNIDNKYEEKKKRFNSREPLVRSRQHSSPREPVSYHEQVKRQENSASSNAQALESAHCAANDEDVRMRQIPDQNENSYPEKANHNDKSEWKRDRLSSILPRNIPKQQSILNSQPCELVSYLKREEPRECPTPNIEDVRINRARPVTLEFANDDFADDDARGFIKNATWPAFPEPSIFTHRRKEEFNKPVRDRCCTMDISQI